MYLTSREVIINLLLDMREAQTTTRKIQALFKEDPYLKFIYKEEKSKIEIEEFLDGNLSPHEVKHFENKMKKDPDLIDKVNLRHKINIAVKDMPLVEAIEKAYYEYIHSETPDQYQPKPHKASSIRFYQRNYIRWVAAASIVFFIGLYLTMFSSNSNHIPIEKRLYSQYYAPFKIIDNDLTYLVNSSGLDEARLKYQKGDYRGAYIVFDNLPENIQIQTEKHFYKGLSLMEMNAFDKAIENFNLVLEQEKSELLPQAYWYLGLCCLQTNQKEKAKAIFTKIKANNIYNSDKAEIILNALK